MSLADAWAALVALSDLGSRDPDNREHDESALSDVALAYARARGWAPVGHVRVVPSKAGNAPELATLESALAEERRKVAALAGALRTVLESVPAPTSNAVTALEHARKILERIG